MTMTLIEAIVDETTAGDDDSIHLVCHCTNDNIAACGLDVTYEPLDNDAPDEKDCPLCVLAWPDGSLECPWGCTCEECAA